MYILTGSDDLVTNPQWRITKCTVDEKSDKNKYVVMNLWSVITIIFFFVPNLLQSLSTSSTTDWLNLSH